MKNKLNNETNPCVSIIIPTYFRNEDLKQAIKSCQSQTYPNIQVIVVDDSGEGHAEAVCSELDVQYIKKAHNEGMMAAWNDGIKHATGEYIQILDDDDELLPEKIEKQVSLLTQQNDTGVVHCGMQWDFGVTEYPDPEMSGNVLPKVLTLDTSPCVTSTLLMEKDVVDEIYPIDEYEGAADDVLKIELAQRTKFDYVDEILVLRGTGENNVSASMKPVRANKRILEEYAEVYDQVDDQILREAMSKTLYREGYAHLSEEMWSARAIQCFARSIYIAPLRSNRAAVIFLSSFGGRPAVSFVEKIGAKLKSVLQ